MKYLSDQELISLYLEGDERSLETIITRHKDKVFRFIYSKVQNEAVAEDLFQETFMKVILKLKGGYYKEEGKFVSWVMRIAFNLSIDYFRDLKKMTKVRESNGNEDYNIFDLLPLTDENVEQEMVKDQIFKDIRNLITQLPKDQKEVIEMRIFEELIFKDIAERTNVSINTSLGRMRYALLNIRKLIQENGISLEV